MHGRHVLALALLAACGRKTAPPTSSTPAAAPAPAPAPAAPTAPTPVPPPASAGSGHDIHQACSMITAAEVSTIVGFPVTAEDDGFRCKFVDAKQGWLQVELMEASSRGAHDICEYAPSKRTVVPGVGDSASYLGATACVKLGDVAIVVDSSNLAEHSAELGRSGADSPSIRVAKLVASRIP